MAIFFIILFSLIILSRIKRLESQCEHKSYRVSSDKSLMKKWAPVLDFTSNTCPPIPDRDRMLLANLYEQSECYCRKNNLSENIFLLEIRQNYKKTTYDFN